MRWMIRTLAIVAAVATIEVGGHLEKTRPLCSPLLSLASWTSLLSATAKSTIPAPQLLKKTLIVAGDYSAGRTYAVGDRGLIFVSENDNSDWIVGETPTRRLLTGVASPDENHAWAVGHDAVILFSSDGGQTWIEQFSAPDEEAPLFGVWFDNPSRGIAFGAYGLIVETTDGGNTWTQKQIDEEGPHHYALCESPTGSLYIAGEFGSVFRSEDKGRTWNKLPSPYGGTFFGALALKDGSVLIFGLRGNLFRSDDEGENWSKLATGTTGSLLGGNQLSDGRVVIVGLNGITLESRDGHTFTSSSRPDRLGHSTVVETPNQILLFGEGGVRAWSPENK